MRRLCRLAVPLLALACALAVTAVALADKPSAPPGRAKKERPVVDTDKRDATAREDDDDAGDDDVKPAKGNRQAQAVDGPPATAPAATAAPAPAATPSGQAPAQPVTTEAAAETTTGPIALQAGAPELGERLGVVGLGNVRVKARGGSEWTDITGDAGLVPDNTVVDAREGGAVLRVAVDEQGTQQAAWLAGAIFTVHQPAKPGGVTELVLHGGNFRRCDGLGETARTAARRRSPVVRRLWGNGHGRFRTRGRYAAATVRGTIWSVEDRCGSTVTKVLQGVVAVRDLGSGSLSHVHAGERLRVAAGPR
jgi:hypothetical protein